jgi:hypothetical protein
MSVSNSSFGRPIALGIKPPTSGYPALYFINYINIYALYLDFYIIQ